MRKQAFDPLRNGEVDSTPELEDLRQAILEQVRRYSEAVAKNKRFIPGRTPIPAAQKVLDPVDLQFLVSSSLDAWLTSGRFNEQFEGRFAGVVGTRYARTVNSGSSANLVAVSSLTSERLKEERLSKGDEVITVAAGFPTTVNPIIQNGLVPVFVDIEVPTYNIDVDRIEEAITERTGAIFVAHTLGNPFELDRVRRICEERSLWLIEDCCDALGSTYGGEPVGSWGDIGTFSFYPAHHITMGEGGAVVTDDDELAVLVESVRDWGRDCRCPPGKENVCGARFDGQYGGLPPGYDHKYVYSNLGYNLKVTDMQAAVGLSQLDKLPEFVRRRKDNFSYLREELAGLEGQVLLPRPTGGSDPSWFGFPISVVDGSGTGRRRRALIEHLDKNRIGTRLLFGGNLTKQPYMSGLAYRVPGELTRTDQVMNDTFWIGVHPGLTEEMLEHMVKTIIEFF